MMIIMVFDTKEEADKFTRIYDQYKEIIYYTVRRFTVNEADIEDYLQDIYIIIGENLDNIDESNQRKTQNYLITITRNYCVSQWRKAKKRQEKEYLDELNFNAEKENPINIIVKNETYSQVKQALDQLDVKYRAALELRYVNGLDDDTIARILNISKKNVQLHVFRAKRMVRSYIEELNHE